MSVDHGGRPCKGHGSKRKGVDEYAAEHPDLSVRAILRGGQLVRMLVCRFCCQSIGARSDRIREHLNSKRHHKLKMEALSEPPQETNEDATQGYYDESKLGRAPEPLATIMLKGTQLAHVQNEGFGCHPPREGAGGSEPLNHFVPTPPTSLLTEQTTNSQLQCPSASLCPPSLRDKQLVCIRWDNFQSNIVSMFSKLRSQEQFIDVTLWCEGQTIKCHKIILSACSTYFEKVLTELQNPHPVIFLKDVCFWEVEALVEFMYCGEVSIHVDKLQGLVSAAEALKIKGLGCPSDEMELPVEGMQKMDENISNNDSGNSHGFNHNYFCNFMKVDNEPECASRSGYNGQLNSNVLDAASSTNSNTNASQTFLNAASTNATNDSMEIDPNRSAASSTYSLNRHHGSDLLLSLDISSSLTESVSVSSGCSQAARRRNSRKGNTSRRIDHLETTAFAIPTFNLTTGLDEFEDGDDSVSDDSMVAHERNQFEELKSELLHDLLSGRVKYEDNCYEENVDMQGEDSISEHADKTDDDYDGILPFRANSNMMPILKPSRKPTRKFQSSNEQNAQNGNR